MTTVLRNKARADAIIEWIEANLKVTVGSKNTLVGSPFRLAKFQREFIRDVYEPFDPANPAQRLVNKGVFSVGRKNGKSELAAALVLVHLLGPESETFGSIVSGATTRKQAKLVFDAVVRFLTLSPNLRKHVKIVESTSTIAVMTLGKRCSGSRYIAVAAEAGGAQGLNPSVVIMDELAQATDGGKFYRALEASQKARQDPFIMVISTQASDPEHVLSQLIQTGLKRREGTTCSVPLHKSCAECGEHRRIVSHLYAAPDSCDLLDPDAHAAANPALGLWIDAARFMDEAREAAESPSAEAHFRLYGFNQQISLTQSLITRKDWAECLLEPDPATPFPTSKRDQDWFGFAEKETIYLGLDMSRRTDLTALVAVSADGVKVKSWFWKPLDDLKAACERDDVTYDAYRDRGWLICPPGRSIDPTWLIETISELNARYTIAGLAFDRPMTGELFRLMADAGLASEGSDAGIRMVPWNNSNTGMEPAIAALEHHVLQGTLRHDGNPILTNNVMNAVVEQNFAGFRRFNKDAARFRIDGAVALAMAMGLRGQDITESVAPNPFEDPAFTYYFG